MKQWGGSEQLLWPLVLLCKGHLSQTLVNTAWIAGWWGFRGLLLATGWLWWRLRWVSRQPSAVGDSSKAAGRARSAQQALRETPPGALCEGASWDLLRGFWGALVCL